LSFHSVIVFLPVLNQRAHLLHMYPEISTGYRRTVGIVQSFPPESSGQIILSPFLFIGSVPIGLGEQNPCFFLLPIPPKKRVRKWCPIFPRDEFGLFLFLGGFFCSVFGPHGAKSFFPTPPPQKPKKGGRGPPKMTDPRLFLFSEGLPSLFPLVLSKNNSVLQFPCKSFKFFFLPFLAYLEVSPLFSLFSSFLPFQFLIFVALFCSPPNISFFFFSATAFSLSVYRRGHRVPLAFAQSSPKSLASRRPSPHPPQPWLSLFLGLHFSSRFLSGLEITTRPVKGGPVVTVILPFFFPPPPRPPACFFSFLSKSFEYFCVAPELWVDPLLRI